MSSTQGILETLGPVGLAVAWASLNVAVCYSATKRDSEPFNAIDTPDTYYTPESQDEPMVPEPTTPSPNGATTAVESAVAWLYALEPDWVRILGYTLLLATFGSAIYLRRKYLLALLRSATHPLRRRPRATPFPDAAQGDLMNLSPRDMAESRTQSEEFLSQPCVRATFEEKRRASTHLEHEAGIVVSDTTSQSEEVVTPVVDLAPTLADSLASDFPDQTIGESSSLDYDMPPPQAADFSVTTTEETTPLIYNSDHETAVDEGADAPGDATIDDDGVATPLNLTINLPQEPFVAEREQADGESDDLDSPEYPSFLLRSLTPLVSDVKAMTMASEPVSREGSWFKADYPRTGELDDPVALPNSGQVTDAESTLSFDPYETF